MRETSVCQICQQSKSPTEGQIAELIRPSLLEFMKKLTFGERLSDRIAEFGGSWRFLITFFSILLLWIIINGVLLLTRAFDPFPFILLNLILSCLAAVQAPVIMMSQNRAEARDHCARKTITKSISKPSSRSGTCTKKSITFCAGNTIGSSKLSRFRSNYSKKLDGSGKAD